MRREPFGQAELLYLLNELLESVCASARALDELSQRLNPPEMSSLLLSWAQDDGGFCVMLRGHIKRLGGKPSDATGFYEEFLAGKDLAEQMSLLHRDQSAVVRMLAEMLPRLRDDTLYTDLKDMHDAHVDNIADANRRAARFVES